MKKRIIKSVVLTIVFVLAVIGFSALTNQGDTDMTKDMEGATLPTLSFYFQEQEVNTLVGHKNEMNINEMRDYVLPYETEQITGRINRFEASIKTVNYEILSLDGLEVSAEGTAVLDGDQFSIPVLGQEGESLLKVSVLLENEEMLHYYTRIVKDTDFYGSENLEYLLGLHGTMLAKKETAALKRGMEPNAEGNNSTLQHVTIHSDMNHALWGDLQPEVVSKVEIGIKEINAAYMSVLLSYRVECAGDNNDSELYSVKEFFKVGYNEGRNFLLEYDRKTTEIFDATNVVLSSKGIILGMTDENIPYKVNKEGTVAAFVVERQLWNYNKIEDEFSLVFGFVTPENIDVRNYHDQHGVRILSMEDNGNMTFSVYGYMNRGDHEGESGLAIYYYNMQMNSIEEKAFIRSNDSCLGIEQDLNRLAYYNAEQDILYLLVQEDLYKINLTDGSQEVLIENMHQDQYVTSQEGHMIGYQNGMDSNSITVWNFAKDTKLSVGLAGDEIAVPLGFVGEDFVYGITRPEDYGQDTAGQEVQAMSRVEIRDASNKVVKSYGTDGIYVLDALIKDNMITLTRAEKDGERYVGISEDYITNNKETTGKVELKSYWTDLKETQYRILFDDGIETTKTNLLQPKYTLYETLLTFESESKADNLYYVYGHGALAGRYENAADAVEHADDLSGVVISPSQRLVWEDGNRVAWYRNFNISRFVAESGETSVAACLRKILAYENVEGVDVMAQLESKAPEAVLSEFIDGEGVRFRGASCKDMFYLIDKGTLVLAMKDSTSAALLIGYDAVSVTYVDVESGSIKNCSIEKMDEMTAKTGNTYIGYVK